MSLVSRSALPLLLLALAGAACSDSSHTATPESGDAGDAGAPTPVASYDVGALGIHRLNSTEYDNTIRDLLGDDSKPSAAFPPDDGADSFTNIADALTISPLLFEAYESAAERLATGASSNPSIVTCEDTQSTADCVEAVMSRFLPRAFRRPVTSAEIARYVQIALNVTAVGGSRTDGLQGAIQAVLLSPNFLFRIESDPKPGDTTPHLVNDYELASRLSYFLWSSMPDDVLFQYAKAGTLSHPDVFDRQLNRMLEDPKAQTLIDTFATPWLLHAFDDASPDASIYPEWSDELRADMRGETRAFLGSFLFQDQSFADILDARFTYMNARLATHYGIAGPSSTKLQRVTLQPGSHRGGLLTQASVLTMTSVSTRTSPVRRGEWVLAELLCAPPPPPPPGVPPLEATISVGTMRQRMDAHRKNPICATCHTQMDPIGFALEHYDGIGQWRDTDQGLPIDASGQLPGGLPIDGEMQLAAAIKSDPRFSRCATRKMFTFALGRVVQGFDEARLLDLTNRFGSGNYRLRALITDIVHTDAFRMRHGR